MPSFIVSGLSVNVRNFAAPRVRPAIRWVQDAAGNWNGSDRGASQDVYETKVTFYDTEANINTLQTTLDSNREAATLSSFGTDPIFAPNVDHSGSITAAVVEMGQRRQVGYAANNTHVFEFDAVFRAVSPGLIATPAASLADLTVQPGFEADKSYTSLKAFTFSGAAFYKDHRSDIGLFRGRFRQTLAQARAIIRYVLVTARATAVAFPTLTNLTYPFGVIRGGLPKNCKIIDLALTRADFVFWDLDLTFAESV